MPIFQTLHRQEKLGRLVVPFVTKPVTQPPSKHHEYQVMKEFLQLLLRAPAAGGSGRACTRLRAAAVNNILGNATAPFSFEFRTNMYTALQVKTEFLTLLYAK